MTTTVPRARGRASEARPRSPRAAAVRVPGGPAPRTRGHVAVAVACAGVAALALVGAALAAGAPIGPSTDGLPDAGALVRWGVPVLRLAATVVGVLTVGLLLTCGVLAPGGGGAGVAPLAGSWAVLGVALAVLGVHEIAAVPLGGLGPADVVATAWALGPTRAWLVCAALATGVLVLAVTGRTGLLGLGGALTALAVPASAGHAATMPDHAGASGALVVHVLAAALWVGGLAGIVLVLRPGSPALQPAVARFSPIALGCVVALGLSGVTAAATAVGPVGPAWWSPYGILLLGKTGALVVLVVCGALHRRRTLPALAAGRAAPFVRLVAVELLVMAAAAGLATALARTPQTGTGEGPPLLPGWAGGQADPLLLAAATAAGAIGAATAGRRRVACVRHGPAALTVRSGAVLPVHAPFTSGSVPWWRGRVVVVLGAVVAGALPVDAAVPRVVLLGVVLPAAVAWVVGPCGPPAGAPSAPHTVPSATVASGVLVLAVLAAVRSPAGLVDAPAPAHLLVPALGLLAGVLLSARHVARVRDGRDRLVDVTTAAAVTAALGTAHLVAASLGSVPGNVTADAVVDAASLLGGALAAVLVAWDLHRRRAACGGPAPD